MFQVDVYNEWDPLEEIIVGSPKYAKIPGADDKSFMAVQTASQDIYTESVSGNVPKHVIEETEEDIARLIKVLEQANVIVRRPSPVHCDKKIVTPYWESDYYFSYCPRDIFLTIGNQIIETPCVFRSRYFESFAYKDLMLNYMKNGARWISAPKPCLKDEIYNYPLTDKDSSAINDNEPVFEAANILRAGRDLFYLVSDGGNEMGLKWLKTILEPEYRIHACRNLYSSLHMDTTVTLLRPGLVLLNPERVKSENLPAPLKKWDKIWAPEMQEGYQSSQPPMTSKWFGMNSLMINPALAVVDKNQLPLIRLLEKHKINVVALELRHGRALGGGFHCITLDMKRKGKLENYF